MRKILYLMLGLIIFSAASMKSQVTIGTLEKAHGAALLDLQNADGNAKGLKLPSVTLNPDDLTQFVLDDEQDKATAKGMLVYNTTDDQIYFWNGSTWALILAQENGTVGPEIPVSSVSLNKTTTTLLMGQTETLVATISPVNATNKNIVWYSDNTEVASVYNGTITTMLPGKARITVIADGLKTATCLVTVSDGSTVVHIGNNDYKTYDYNGTIWMVENSREGTSSATGNKGNYYTWEQATQVNNACPTGWSLPTKEQWDGLVSIVGSDKDGVGKWWNNIIYGAFAGNYFNGTLFQYGTNDYWWSATEPYQNYSSSGTLSGPYTYSSNHWFTVRCVKDGGITPDPQPIAVTSVSLNKTTTTLMVGASETLTATIAPANATNKNVIWYSDNTGIATVSNGIISGVSAGNATITAIADGLKTATCLVTVSDGSTFMHIGNNDYKTYDYNGTIWMVQNSREGASSATGPKGNYYSWEQASLANNACPTGWSLPTQEQWTDLVAIVGSDKDGVGKWWNNSIYGDFAGNYFNGTLFSFGLTNYWWSTTSSYQSYYSNGSLGGPSTYTTNHWFTVRCVKN